MKINILLPYKEKFDKNKASSVSITVKNNLLHTKFLSDIRVYGQNVENPLFKDNFHGITSTIFSLKSKNVFLAHEMLKIILNDSSKEQLIEVHNRPYLIDQIANNCNFPITLFLHNDPQSMKGTKTVKDRQNILEKCEAVFCVSEFIKNKFLEGISIKREKVHVLYNGVDRKIKKFPEKKKEILFVGRLVYEKGADLYVQAVSSIASCFPDWNFGLIGSFRLGEHNNTNSYAHRVIKSFQEIGSQAIFYGFKNHEFVEEKMKTASIIVIPSIWEEPFGLVAAEAMSNGISIIASKVGGMPEIIRDNGVLIDNINYKKLRKNLIELLKSRSLRKSYQQRAWENFKHSSALSSKKLDSYRRIIFQNYY